MSAGSGFHVSALTQFDGWASVLTTQADALDKQVETLARFREQSGTEDLGTGDAGLNATVGTLVDDMIVVLADAGSWMQDGADKLRAAGLAYQHAEDNAKQGFTGPPR